MAQLSVTEFWDSGAVQIGILGPLEVRSGDLVVDVAGARLRRLLIRLALDAGRPVSGAALADAVWGDQPPVDEANALQSLVSRLRRALGGAGLVGQSPIGYRLAIEPGDVDANRFEQLARAGAEALRSGAQSKAASMLREALALWRGPALADVEDAPFAAATVSRLDDLRLTAIQDRIDADLTLGNGARVVAELDALAADHPLDERIAGQRMKALAGVGRQAEALAEYERMRARLADELGVDPSAELREIHLAVLRGGAATATATATPRTNLRAQLTSFVGRDDEVARIGKLLDEGRLVTLVGPGGAGKTRLAVEAAAVLVDGVPDGIWFVELASVTDAADVPQTVLGSLGLRESYLLEQPTKLTPRDAISRLLDGLGDKRAVVVLDNCEHLIDATAELTDQLLAQCRALRVVTTSREPLGIFGESLIVVPPLGQPAPDAAPAEALEYPAVRLFADRAAAVRPDFGIDDSNVRAVIEIVRRLDGLPLAIELAAARLRSLPIDEIAARLSDRFRLLTGGSRTALPRHRTLRAVVEWSWDLLTPPERTLVERLAVFPAGTTPRSAEAVCADDDVPADDVLDLLASLVDKSLLQESGQTDVRYRMLETIREYGQERLAERGELTGIRAAHAAYFAELVKEAEPHLRRPEQLVWIAVLNAERDNVLAALRHLGDQGDAQAALDMAVSIGWYWSLLGSHAEALTWISFALDVPGDTDPVTRLVGEAIRVMNSTISPALLPTEDLEDGKRRIADLSARLDEVDATSIPLLALLKPVVAMFSGDIGRVEQLIEESFASPDPWVRAALRSFRAAVAENSGDVESLRVDAEQAVREFRELGDRWGLANSLQMLAQLRTVNGELDDAIATYEEALALVVEMGAREDQALMHVRLADLRMRNGDLAEARRLVQAADRMSEATGSVMESLFARAVLAELARLDGDMPEARRLRDESLRRLDEISPAHPIQGHGKAIMLAIAAKQDLVDGAPDLARERLAAAHETAIGTKDMPIVASVGVAVSDLAAQTAQPVDAAEMLGAAARLRGADDATNLDIRRLMATLREALGDAGFEDAYERGRALDREAAIARLDPAVLD
jgi:predicted ATPase/DNA-binding SARP family transcriptional activator